LDRVAFIWLMINAAIACRRGPFASRAAWVCGIFLALSPAMATAVFVVNAPWVHPAEKGGATEAYMTLTSTEGATLVGVRSDIALSVVIVTAAGKSKSIERLSLSAGDTVGLKPGASRLRLLRLTRTLKLGDRVPLVLTVEYADGKRQEIPVDAEVRRRSPIDDHLHGHAH